MFNLRASLSVITPCDVEIIAIPNPFKTRGNDFESTYLLSPGELTRSNLLIAGNLFSGWYFKAILIIPGFDSSSNL